MRHNDFIHDNIFKTLLLFSIPIIITNTVTLLFHAADVAVLAFFSDDSSVAAVGACGSLITLMVALFFGLAEGANVLIAKRMGAQDKDGARKAIGTSLIIGFLSGLFLMTISLIFARDFLILMKCQEDVLDMATLYLTIYFVGSPILMTNSFSQAILRSLGESGRVMCYSLLSGVINIIFNIIFVALFDLHVIGVAIATVLSALISLILAFIRLFGKRTGPNLKWRDIRLGRLELIEIVRVGIPTCISALFFYAANVVLSSAVNSISTEAMTANAISGQFDGIIYTVGAAIAAASSVMVAQNYGAKKINRIKKIIPIGIVYSTAVSLTLGSLFVITAEPLLGLLSDSRSVIEIAKDRMTLLCLTYFVTSIMEIFAFSLRALKRQKSTVIAGGICGFGIRCLWRFFVWPKKPTLSALFACFPVSAAAAIIIYLFVYRDALKDLNEDISLKI